MDRAIRFGAEESIDDEPEAPPEVQYVLDWFYELSRQRKSGPEPISWADIDAWARLRDVKPDQLEIEAILMLDATFISMIRQEQKDQQERMRDKGK